jgi:hypothetical protein
MSNAQINGDSIDFIMKMKAIRMADSLYLLEHPNDSNRINKMQKTFWVYDGQGNVIGGSGKRIKVGAVKLVDSLTNNYYIMDSTHIYITAYNKSGKVLWKTDPYKDNSIGEYRTKRPVIVHYGFGESHNFFSDKIKEGSKVIWITYNNTQFGFIDLKSGKYYWCGQD